VNQISLRTTARCNVCIVESPLPHVLVRESKHVIWLVCRTHMHVHPPTCTHSCTLTHTHPHARSCTYAPTHPHSRTLTHMHVRTHSPALTHAHASPSPSCVSCRLSGFFGQLSGSHIIYCDGHCDFDLQACVYVVCVPKYVALLAGSKACILCVF
jgi:hypothetical protein